MSNDKNNNKPNTKPTLPKTSPHKNIIRDERNIRGINEGNIGNTHSNKITNTIPVPKRPAGK